MKSIINIYSTINKIAGVVDVIDVKMNIARGSGYNNPNISLDNILSNDGTKLIPPKNVILEIKNFERDIRGSAQW